MKKLISTLLALAMIVSLAGVAAALPEQPTDRDANLSDALEVLREIIGLENIACVTTHDFNENGRIDIQDGLLVLKGIIGIGAAQRMAQRGESAPAGGDTPAPDDDSDWKPSPPPPDRELDTGDVGWLIPIDCDDCCVPPATSAPIVSDPGEPQTQTTWVTSASQPPVIIPSEPPLSTTPALTLGEPTQSTVTTVTAVTTVTVCPLQCSSCPCCDVLRICGICDFCGIPTDLPEPPPARPMHTALRFATYNWSDDIASKSRIPIIVYTREEATALLDTVAPAHDGPWEGWGLYSTYDEAFFKSNHLVAVYVVGSPASLRVSNVTSKGTEGVITFTDTHTCLPAPAVMVTWLHFIEMPISFPVETFSMEIVSERLLCDDGDCYICHVYRPEEPNNRYCDVCAGYLIDPCTCRLGNCPKALPCSCAIVSDPPPQPLYCDVCAGYLIDPCLCRLGNCPKALPCSCAIVSAPPPQPLCPPWDCLEHKCTVCGRIQIQQRFAQQYGLVKI